MPRLFSTALLFVLLGATGVAFVVTEGLKLEPSPITKVFVTKHPFSPTCECSSDSATIAFRLRKAQRLTLSIVDKNGNQYDQPTPNTKKEIQYQIAGRLRAG